MPINLIAAVIVTAGLVFSAMFGRYEIVSAGAGQQLIYRVDRFTGRVESCQTTIAYAIGRTITDTETVDTAIQPNWCVPYFMG